MKIKSKAKKQEDVDKHLNELLDAILNNKPSFNGKMMVETMKKSGLTDEEMINIAVPTPLGREIIKYLLKEVKDES